jgi:hypothetical protein
MSKRFVRVGGGSLILAAVLAGVGTWGPATAAGPLDVPVSSEPRVVVATSKAKTGLVSSRGVGHRFHRLNSGSPAYSRDLLLALPGFKGSVVSQSKRVRLWLWGNLPGLSDSPVLESAAILHDTSHYDLDFTPLRGRFVLANNRTDKGAARIWLRTDVQGVAVTLPSPGDRVAFEIYGRWAPGVPFDLKGGADHAPVRLWEVYALEGRVQIEAGPNEWSMSAPPGRAYFHGDSVGGPDQQGPVPLKKLPAWADPKAPRTKTAEMIEGILTAYRERLREKEEQEVANEALALADKDKSAPRARMLRRLVIHALAAMDDVKRVVQELENSKNDTIRKTAVVALRHWIGVRASRDEKLYSLLTEDLGWRKPEAETVMQLLHSPFSPNQPETYETLIRYLGHRRQAVRELAHWHLVRLAPIGAEIPFDASAPEAERAKAIAAWKKLIPAGELPREKEDETKKKDGKGKKE